MHKRILSVVLLALAAAMAFAEAPEPERQASIHIYRPSRFTAAARRPSIYVDGKEVGRLRVGTYFQFEVAPGTHTITSAPYVQGEANLTFAPGQEYFFRLRTGSWVKGSIGRAGITLEQVSREQGQLDMRDLKRVDVMDNRH